MESNQNIFLDSIFSKNVVWERERNSAEENRAGKIEIWETEAAKRAVREAGLASEKDLTVSYCSDFTCLSHCEKRDEREMS